MKQILIIAGLLLSLSFSSCDPSYSVIISNKSATSRHIRFVYPANFKYPVKDSITVYDNEIKAAKRYRQPPMKTALLSKDTLQRTYTFLLKSNHDAVIEGASFAAFPNYGQLFIIDEKDSVLLKKKDKTFRRSWFIGGTWIYTIKN